MPATLRLGSFGSEVKQLQQSLNLLPTQLQRLVPDGSFGPKTHGRTVEFQKQSALVPDGIVGPFTWARLLDLISQLVPPGTIPPGLDTPPKPAGGNGSRAAVVTFANGDAIEGGVAAKTAGGKDSRTAGPSAWGTSNCSSISGWQRPMLSARTPSGT